MPRPNRVSYARDDDEVQIAYKTYFVPEDEEYGRIHPAIMENWAKGEEATLESTEDVGATSEFHAGPVPVDPPRGSLPGSDRGTPEQHDPPTYDGHSSNSDYAITHSVVRPTVAPGPEDPPKKVGEGKDNGQPENGGRDPKTKDPRQHSKQDGRGGQDDKGDKAPKHKSPGTLSVRDGR